MVKAEAKFFNFHQISKLPRLAWCAVVHGDKKHIDVFHGPHVEIRGSFFVEGAWDKSFEYAGFDDSTVFMGSGGKIIGDKVLFAAPCHTLERLYLLHSGPKVFLSNSMIFLLNKSKFELDINYIPYHSAIISIQLGTKDYTRSVPTLNNNRIFFYSHCNIQIDKELNIKELKKKSPPTFSDFASYKGFLISKLKGLSENANAESRIIKYSLLGTVSSGYDSAACAALGREIGCEKVITLSKGQKCDSGAEIAAALGYTNIKKYDQKEYMNIPGFPEAEFVATGVLGEDMVMAPFEQDMERSILLTGFHGDRCWRLSQEQVTPYIVRGDPSGSDMGEFRLRVGFIHAPISFWGAAKHQEIRNISNSVEMRPWVLGRNFYDRPIPRRIVEESKVARHLFGQKKQYIAVKLWISLKSMKSKMTPQSFHDFIKFYKAHKKQRTWAKQTYYRFMYSFYFTYLLFKKLVTLLLGIPLHVAFTSSPWWFKFTNSPDAPSFLLHWGKSVIENRYAINDENFQEKDQN